MPAPEGPRGVRALPAHPNLEHLKNEAKDRLRALRTTDPAAKLADAQFQLAREYGFASWRQLKAHVDEAAQGPFGVLLLNDDVTPMEFVVEVLENVFGMRRGPAIATMFIVHRAGKAMCGHYDREEAEARASRVRALAEARRYPLQCAVEPIRRDVPGRIGRALAEGASAADVARMMLEEGKLADPDTAVWVKAPEMPGGFGLGYSLPGAAHNLAVIPDFFGYVPPGGIDKLPTLEEAFGPAPPPPPSPDMAAIGRMVMAGATPAEAAEALHALGMIDPRAPSGEVVVLDMATARFVRTRLGPLVCLHVSHSDGRGFVGVAIPGTEFYPAKDTLPFFPPDPADLDPETPSWLSL